MADTRLKIAVFIDFDNIEIGVKSTLGVQFDVGVVLEALKERGDVVSKIAYGDWTRAGDYSRSLTQHATKLVQRNLTPGGDKNGADINLALDALEMAFTHSHINAYVIVGGDSDFITLVEKLKQYDKQIFVVGGRAFTSLVMQRNCHEFIAYENLVGSRRSHERGRQSGPPVALPQASLEQSVPLVRRALKVLADREVSPQLGLLKSTLLQLDSTFSERTYGAGSFRDFAQKLAAAGHVTLRENGRNVLVEYRDSGLPASADDTTRPAESVDVDTTATPSASPAAAAPVAAPAAASAPAAGEPRVAEGVREVRRLFQSAQNPPRWPMYIRQAKQFLRNVDATFDERKFGFASLVDLLRACQRDGLFRIERDRQGVMRLFPGNVMQAAADAADADDVAEGVPPHVAHQARIAQSRHVRPGRPIPVASSEDGDEEADGQLQMLPPVARPVADDEEEDETGAEVVEGAVVQAQETSAPVDGDVESDAAGDEARQPGNEVPPRSRARKRTSAKTSSRKAGEASGSRARKTPARAGAGRGRSRKQSPSE